jgi:penicillin-insensitive murein endopeptidase
MIRLTILALLVLVMPVPGAPASASEPVRIIGGGGEGGCIQGAARLPETGPGYVTIRMSRSDFWGAPIVLERIQTLARQVQAAGLPELMVGDISHPKGGPMGGGHVSHQRGLEVDIGLDMRPRPPMTRAERETHELISLVRPDRRGVEPTRWHQGVVTLLRLAVSLPEVDRVLVNPAIKKQLCAEVTGDRVWLRLIRPWYAHAAHLHLTFRCPAGQTECRDLPPPPAGDGCDASLQWWFDQLDAPPAPTPSPPVARPRPPRAPAACQPILADRN